MAEYAQPSSIGDRLGSTLFVAALVHGIVILGVTFSGGSADTTDDKPALRVALVTPSGRVTEAPDDAEFIANQNQRGGGDAMTGDRPTTALSPEQLLTIEGDPLGADIRDATPREESPAPDRLTANRPSDAAIQPDPTQTDSTASAPMRAAAMLNVSTPQTLAAEIDFEAQLTRQTDSDSPASPSTRASAIASYLDRWRGRVEMIGTTNFPARLRERGNSAGRPTLQVTIRPDGSLAGIIIVSSSGDRAVDQAALNILRLAAPFEPLPAVVLDEFDVLPIVYEWDFISGSRAPADRP